MRKNEKGEKADSGLVQYAEEKGLEEINLDVGGVKDGVTRGTVVTQEIWQQNLRFSYVNDVKINHFKKKMKNKNKYS